MTVYDLRSSDLDVKLEMCWWWTVDEMVENGKKSLKPQSGKKSLNPEMAMRVAATAAISAHSRVSAHSQMGMGLKVPCSSFSSFPLNVPQTKLEKPPPTEPSTNLFVSGLNNHTTTSEGLRDDFTKFGDVDHGHRKIHSLRRITAAIFPFSTISSTDHHQHISSLTSKSELLKSYTVTPPIKPWPQKLTTKRLCSIISQQQNLDLAVQIFHYAGNYHPNFHHNYETYHAIIHKLSRLRAFEPIPALLNELHNSRIRCGENVFITLIRYYGLASKPKEAIKIFLQINDFGVQRSVRSLNTLLNALVQNKKYDTVYLMFKNCRKRFEILPNVFTCNILLKALCKKDDAEGAVKVLDEMPGMGMVPNLVSYTTIMAWYVDCGDMLGAKRMFNELLDRGWLPDATTYTVLMDGFCKLGQFVDATKVMDEMVANGVEPNDVTYGVMIESLCKVKKSGEAVNMISDMLDNNYVPSSALCCRVIDVLCREGKVEEACKLWKLLLVKNCTPDNVILSTLIHWLCKEGKVWEAKKLFDEFERGSIPSVLTYNMLIAGMCDRGELCEAGRLWDDMVERGCPPNSFTYNLLIKGFSKNGFAEEGIKIFEEMLDRGCSPNESTYSILIEGLCNSGRVPGVLNVLSVAASNKVEVKSDSWKILVNKFVSDRDDISVSLESILSENVA
ncbi:Pentatricopeptide repeat superfamily protein [Perilla frutescens var. hirtella]|nr:Pentatricopeptide repeat superfamily protein [Perilla frutescens var. hirtella]